MKGLLKIVTIAMLFCGLSIPVLAQDKSTEQLTLTVNAGTLSFTTTTLPNGQVSLAYTGVSLAVTGGVTPYTFSLASGSLPAGISLSSAGAFSGTPTTAGTSSFTVKVTDSESPAVSATSTPLTILVINALTITTTSLPSANIGVAYSQQLAASGGVSPYTWSISTGSLPTGLTLSSGGLISGSPTAAGSSTFTIQVTDSATTVPAVKTVVGKAVVPTAAQTKVVK